MIGSVKEILVLIEFYLMLVLNDPNRIFNLDESAFFLCPKGSQVLAKKGSKCVYNKTGNDDKECLTVLFGGNAAGEITPPLILFSYVRLPDNIIRKTPNTFSIGKTDSGWMTAESFYGYISNVFYKFLLEKKIELPVVLFVDGHSSHVTMKLSHFCLDHGMILISLLPSSTHLLQPMDVAVFHPLKKSWCACIQE